MAFCPEHSKRDQNLKFAPLIKQDDEHPRPFYIGVPLRSSPASYNVITAEKVKIVILYN